VSRVLRAETSCRRLLSSARVAGHGRDRSLVAGRAVRQSPLL